MGGLQFLGLAGSTQLGFRLGLQAATRISQRSIADAVQSSSTTAGRQCCCGSISLYSTSRRPPSAPSSPACPTRPPRPLAPTRWRTTVSSPATTPSPYRPRIQRRTLLTRVVKNYAELPPDYDDHVGLPFRTRDLDQAEVVDLFGPRMDVEMGNTLLRILHGRRVAGTLEDPVLRHGLQELFSKLHVAAALAYLRKNVPVNEVINAGLRAEDELREIEEAALEEEERQRLIAEGGERGSANSRSNSASTSASASAAPAVTDTISNWQRKLYKDRPVGDVYGVGVMDAIRARNRARREAEEKRLEEEEKRLEEEERLREEEQARLNPGGLQKLEPRRREMSPRMKEWTARATSDMEEPPEMSVWERLWPSFVFAGLVVAGGLVAGMLYAPPQQKHRVWPDVPPAAATALAVIGINAAVWAAWKVPPLWGFLNRNFILVAGLPRSHTPLTAVFSHQSFGHLASNIFFFWLFGTRLHDDVGRANFLAVFLGSGVLAFTGSLTQLVLAGRLHLSTLGTSGAIYGVAACYLIMHRFEGFKIFGLPPDPMQGIQGLGLLGLVAGLAILPLVRPGPHNLDVWSHVFGLAAGVAYGAYFSWQRAAEQEDGQEGDGAKGLEEDKLHNLTFTKNVTVDKPKPGPQPASPARS